MRKHQNLRMTSSVLFLLFILALVPGVLAQSEPAESAGKESVDYERFSHFDTAPTFLDSIAPGYPHLARKAVIEGTVVIRVFIEADGSVCALELENPVLPFLDNAVIKAARESTYSPALLAGQPVPGQILVNYEFNLEQWFRKNIRNERPPICWIPPFITEIGQLLGTDPSQRNPQSMYEYDNVTFKGDLPLEIFRSVVEQLTPHLEDSETILLVNHHLAYKELGIMTEIIPVDLTVLTCSNFESGLGRNMERSFNFTNKDGSYFLQKKNGQPIFHSFIKFEKPPDNPAELYTKVALEGKVQELVQSAEKIEILVSYDRNNQNHYLKKKADETRREDIILFGSQAEYYRYLVPLVQLNKKRFNQAKEMLLGFDAYLKFGSGSGLGGIISGSKYVIKITKGDQELIVAISKYNKATIWFSGKTMEPFGGLLHPDMESKWHQLIEAAISGAGYD